MVQSIANATVQSPFGNSSEIYCWAVQDYIELIPFQVSISPQQFYEYLFHGKVLLVFFVLAVSVCVFGAIKLVKKLLLKNVGKIDRTDHLLMSIHFHLSHGHFGKPIGNVCSPKEPVHAEPDQHLHRQPGLRRYLDVLFLRPFHTHPGVDFTNQLAHKVNKGENIKQTRCRSVSKDFQLNFTVSDFFTRNLFCSKFWGLS